MYTKCGICIPVSFKGIIITDCFLTDKLIKDILFPYLNSRIQYKRIDKKYENI